MALANGNDGSSMQSMWSSRLGGISEQQQQGISAAGTATEDGNGEFIFLHACFELVFLSLSPFMWLYTSIFYTEKMTL
jgi:hypothetical protein